MREFYFDSSFEISKINGHFEKCGFGLVHDKIFFFHFLENKNKNLIEN